MVGSLRNRRLDLKSPSAKATGQRTKHLRKLLAPKLGQNIHKQHKYKQSDMLEISEYISQNLPCPKVSKGPGSQFQESRAGIQYMTADCSQGLEPWHSPLIPFPWSRRCFRKGTPRRGYDYPQFRTLVTLHMFETTVNQPGLFSWLKWETVQ